MSASTARTRVLLLFGSGGDADRSAALDSESSVLAQLVTATDEAVHVAVVSRSPSRQIPGVAEHVHLDVPAQGATDRILTRVGAFALSRRLSSSPLGRVLNSLGPVDPSRVFWRAVRKNSRAMTLLKSADTVIAGDLAATKAAWIALHRGWVGNAYYDPRSGAVGLSWHLPVSDETAQA